MGTNRKGSRERRFSTKLPESATVHLAVTDVVRAAPRSTACKAVGGGNDVIGDARMAGIVTGLVDDDQFAARPMLSQPPWREERVAEVHTPVDQDARNP